MFGVLDTKDNCWMGSPSGPATYADLEIAQVAAAICDERFRAIGRFRACEIESGVNRLRDNVTPPDTFAVAVDRMETRASSGLRIVG